MLFSSPSINPLFPAYRSGHRLFQRPSPGKQFPSIKWIDGWKRRDWKTSDNSPVKNKDLWLRLTAAMTGHKIHWHWVKGHAGHKENERCDELANLAVARRDLPEDAGFGG